MITLVNTEELVADALQSVPAITLDELNEIAALQTRKDHKYLLKPELLGEVLTRAQAANHSAGLAPMRVLEIEGLRNFGYRSNYFDTPELTSYLDAAHNRPKRFKVRSRTYLETRTCWMEVKARTSRQQTAKERVEHCIDDQMRLDGPAHDFIGHHQCVSVDVDSLRLTIITGYRRATLYSGQRVTIDSGLWSTKPNGAGVPLGALNRLLIIETKSAQSTPGPFDRALWSLGIRPVSLSKYAVAMATANPELPANRWHRVLKQQVGRERSELGVAHRDGRRLNESGASSPR